MERVELGKVQIHDNEKQVRYDQLEKLQSSREGLLADKSKIHEVLDVINTIGNWIFTLERLKNGRWTRFGAPESELIKITLLQTQMCDRTLQLYKSLIQAVGATKDIKKIDKEIEKLSLLSKEFNEDLSTYIKIYGVEAFKQN